MDQKLIDELNRKEMTPFHTEMLKKCKMLAKMSRDNMGKNYQKWDRYNYVYRGIVMPDAQDLLSRERKEPEKMVIPVAFAQIQTFVSFALVMLLQKPTFYEVEGVGDEDYSAAKGIEALIQRDLDMSKFRKLLYQFLIDISRYGLGVFKHGWVEETSKQMVEIQNPVDPSVGGVPDGEEPEMITSYVEQEMATFKGNRIWTVPPYRFLPDPRLPLSRFEEGEFCGSEDEYSRTVLMQMQSSGTVAGVEHIPAFNKGTLEDRGQTRFQFAEKVDTVTAGKEANASSVLITEMQVAIIPSEFKIAGEPMGPEKYPVKYLVWYANDQRIIRCEVMGYAHNQWGYDLGEWSPDQSQLVNDGISGTIDALQDEISWLFNTRNASVKKQVDDRMLVDPSGIEPQDLRDRLPVIRLRQRAFGTGVEKWIKQLPVTDVTQNHIKDALALKQIVQEVTGITDNAMGNYASGRRSAFESRTVNSGSAMRIKAPLMVLFDTTFRPMGLKLISNLRQGIDEDLYVKVLGQSANPFDFQIIKVGPEELAGSYDFVFLETTLPSERIYQANGLQELLMGMIQNPEAAAVFGYSPQDLRNLMERILELRGIKAPPKMQSQPPNVPSDQVQPNVAQVGALSQKRTQPLAGFNLTPGKPPNQPQVDDLGDMLTKLISQPRP